MKRAMRLSAMTMIGFFLARMAAVLAQGMLPFPGPGVASAGACSYPLDAVSGAAAAYSTARKLRSAYAGNAFTITRASDSTTQAIGFVSTCLVDTTTIGTFCSGTTCSITTLNDQVGSKNCTQGTLASAPVIYTGGAVVAQINSQPTMSLNGSSQNCDMGVNSSGTLQPASSALTFFAVWRPTAFPTAGNINDTAGAGSLNAGAGSFYIGYDNTPLLGIGTGSISGSVSAGSAPFTDMVMMRTSALTVATAGTMYRNGIGSTATGNWANTSQSNETVAIGKSLRPHFFTGYVAEVYWFTTQLSTANSNILAHNAGTFYALPWGDL